ncbi:MAG: DUF389 domain-containing protein [Anaerolineae bacterium]|nr:DUF389 domain-containing protein [Anaerolineae bacterium]
MTRNIETPPTYARRVLVPVANPVTAPGLIRLAWKLSDPDQGSVLALFVTLSGAEVNETGFKAITRVVKDAQETGIAVKLVTSTASSVARGILDAAREHSVALMVLGFQAPLRGKIVLGPVVESVARTSPCDLVVFRNLWRGQKTIDGTEQIILPLNGSDNSRVAARMGMALAGRTDAQPKAIYVQTDPDLPSWFGLARIEASLTGISDTQRVQRQVIQARDVVSGILTRCDENDMIVLGFSERSPLDRWIYDNVAQDMLAQAPGPVMLVKNATSERMRPSQRLWHQMVTRFSPRLTPSERTDVIRQAFELSQPEINFIVLMLISSVLASFGLLENSTAVIIGAMLVAPLMSPLMSFSIGLIQARLTLMRTAVLTTLLGAGIGLTVAIVAGLLVPTDVITSEMQARGQPNLLDMGIALAAGMVGAFAMARKDIPAALAGVAIAAALVPPLCTVGLAIAMGEVALATGASLLFLINIVSISIAGAGVFAWLGLTPRSDSGTWRNLLISLFVLLLLAVPLAGAGVEAIRIRQRTSDVLHVLQQQFEHGEVIDIEVKDWEISATIRSADPIVKRDVQEAELVLEDKLGHDVDLEITYWRSITP